MGRRDGRRTLGRPRRSRLGDNIKMDLRKAVGGGRIGMDDVLRIELIYILLTAIGLSPGGSSTVHIYTQTIHGTTQNKQYNLGECGPCPVLTS